MLNEIIDYVGGMENLKIWISSEGTYNVAYLLWDDMFAGSVEESDIINVLLTI